MTVRPSAPGKWDVVIENTEGRVFKSRAELSRYIEEQQLQLSVDSFDFLLDTSLKKLRQVKRIITILLRQAMTSFVADVAAVSVLLPAPDQRDGERGRPYHSA